MNQPRPMPFPPPSLLRKAAIPYRIETPRFVLRCYNPSDAPLLAAAVEASVEHLRQFMPWVQNEPLTLAERVELLRGFRSRFDQMTDFVYGLFSPDEDAIWGGCGLHDRTTPNALEIGYWVCAGQVRRGYATEMAAVLTRVAVELAGVKKVEIRCNVENTASAAIPAKLGYHLDGTLRRIVYGTNNELCDGTVWSMLAEEFAGSPASPRAVGLRAFDALGRCVLGGVASSE